jgi:hypothetical protein
MAVASWNVPVMLSVSNSIDSAKSCPSGFVKTTLPEATSCG